MNEDLTAREGKCDYCGQIKTVIEIGLSWACKDNLTCQKIINARLVASGASGYDDDPPVRGTTSKFTSKPKRHKRFED